MRAAVTHNTTMFAGDTEVIEVTVEDDGDAVDLTDAQAIVYSVSVGDGGEPVVYKEIGDGVVVTDNTGGVFQVEIEPADTESLKPRNYRHKARLVEESGRTSVVMDGTLTLLPPINPPGS